MMGALPFRTPAFVRPAHLIRPPLTFVVAALAALVAAGCAGGPEPTPTAFLVPTATPTPTSAPTATPEPRPTPARTTPTSTPTPVPLTLELLAPRDGAGVEIGAVRVLGRTQPNAVVGVNGVPVDIAADGTFQSDVALEPGANLIEVVATDLSGQTTFSDVAVFFISTTAALPLSLFYPSDGLEVSEPTLTVTGGTRPDAVVGVNGQPAEVSPLGIFSVTISLEEGPNFIEVLAADIQDNVRYQTVAVFYLP